ncbi:btk-binding protein-related [Anaeramoeba flamelloides]|uniref:Btk-binding protein-related n=1 Tax=Anaeramoeba flamelloides TaxID=1746091 RepID=A0ABQ8Z0D4_9EUKA|nr:btk-binding protein-related [Anaeramoeba flamelloides]
MSNSPSLYLTGSRRDFSFFTQKKKNNLPKWTKSSIKKTQTIKKLICGGKTDFLVWKKPNKLEFYKKKKKKRKYQLPKNERIKDIVSSSETYLILTESGKVWSLANKNLFKAVPLLDADQSTFEEIRPVTFFEEKKLFVNSVVMGIGSGYYLCNGDQLYASGSNSEGSLGIGENSFEVSMPVYVQDKVIKIFAGNNTMSFFFITSNTDLLYACGSNRNGQLGIGYTVNQYTPTAVLNFKGSEILTVSSGRYQTILINNKGQTFGCGYEETNGLGVHKTIFTLIPQLKEKKAVQLAIGRRRTLVLTEQNELYGWGFDKDQFPTDKLINQKIPNKISLPSFFTNYLESKDQIQIASGARVSFLYLDFKNTLSKDLLFLYKSKKFCDCEIGTLGNQIPVHKSLVECRTKLTIDQIQNKLFGEKPINKEQTLSFLKWIYSDEISDLEKLEQTFNLLELTFPPSVENTLEKDIAQLYQDDNSKDFKILVKIDNDDDEDNEDEENKKVNYEEIPVHKFILLARSGLFRAMFDYVNEKDNTNKVQDYTNKSIESLEILIKYFYTNSIELTADQDPELIVDELSDAVEYYQLNNQCQIKKTQTIKKLVSGNPPNFLVWKKPNKLEFYQKDNKKKKYQLPKNETIKDIVSSFKTFQILTESGKVWSLAKSNHYKVVPLLDADQSTFEEIRPVTFFKEKKLFVNSVVMGEFSGYYLCNGDQLYASGSNAQGRLCIGKYGGQVPMPVYVQDKVIKIFAGNSAFGFFFTTNNPDLLYACGNNLCGQLGIGSIFDQSTPTAVKNFKGSEILTEKKAVQLATEFKGNLVLTDQNELYGWGFNYKGQYPTYESKNDNNKFPSKIKLPSYFTNYLESKDQIRIACGTSVCFLYLDFKNTLSEDLRILLKTKKFCDCEIGTLGNQIPVHKNLIECRTKLTIDQIQNKLFGEKPINKEQTLSFLKWIYYDEISDLEKLEQTFNLLELTFPPSVDNTLEKDIAQLYKDDDSKDFKILVKIEDEENEEEEDNEDEDKEGNYEEIPVHKFILLARSGLFRAMFDYVNEKDNTNQVQDYTHKSIKSLEILIKYFYTNSIELTANEDPELIVEELSGAVEYYQLNDQCNFENELNKIKKQFELN